MDIFSYFNYFNYLLVLNRDAINWELEVFFLAVVCSRHLAVAQSFSGKGNIKASEYSPGTGCVDKDTWKGLLYFWFYISFCCLLGYRKKLGYI